MVTTSSWLEQKKLVQNDFDSFCQATISFTKLRPISMHIHIYKTHFLKILKYFQKFQPTDRQTK